MNSDAVIDLLTISGAVLCGMGLLVIVDMLWGMMQLAALQEDEREIR